MQIHWLGQSELEAHELKEQAKDAAALACAALADAQVGGTFQVVDGAAVDAEAQVPVARDATQQVIAIAALNPGDAEIAGFVQEAQAAVVQTQTCAAQARQLADGLRPPSKKKKGEGWVWAALAAMALAVGVVATS